MTPKMPPPFSYSSSDCILSLLFPSLHYLILPFQLHPTTLSIHLLEYEDDLENFYSIIFIFNYSLNSFEDFLSSYLMEIIIVYLIICVP